ncbi:hypothetical protein [Natronobeatus ordinarius]|uniref:hypothetical protein n=1 Tax=Natronobeatus ordinarius TaxID=2963433 RepID=UPI0020CE5BAA|nr:hypothetical protein [Natronobeatus ordinarius]
MNFLFDTGRPSDDVTDRAAAEEPTEGTKSRRTKLLQGATVFVVMFVVLWWALSRAQQDAE